MQAIVVNRYGGTDALEIARLPESAPAAGQVRVKLAYAGVNFVDIYMREGRYPGVSLPLRPGLEGSGVVAEAAPGSGWSVGDRVAFTTGVQGAYAEQVLVPAEHLVPVPAGTSLRTAAAALEQGLTAIVLADDVARLASGSTAVVHAAAGGVGGLLAQWLKARGVRVLGVVSSAEKADWLASLGIEAIRSGGVASWAERVAELAAADGVEAVFDSVGLATVDASLACLKERGHLILYGAASGPVASVSVPVLMARSLTVTRPRMHHYLGDPAVLGRRAAALFAALASGELQLRIHACLPLAEAGKAHALLESRATLGKVLLAVDEALENRG